VNSDTPDPGKSEKLNLELAQKGPELRKAYTAADYKIGPEDLLDIDVFQVPELKGTFRVSAKGFIKLPLADKIEAAGLTVAELEALIAQRLEKYVKEPVVGVFVKEYRSQQISVLGSVKDPKVYYATGQKYLLDMLSMAGGLSPDAGTVCIIQRNAQADATDKQTAPEKIVIDLNRLLIDGNADLNIAVYGGDVVHVPKSGIFFVDGAVKGSGEYNLKNKVTLTQAISMAKGLDTDASLSDIRIFRESGKPEREVITLDYDAVLDGQEKDIEIKDKDIIIVSSNVFKRFFSRFAAGISSGVFRVGTGTGY
jgi:polysaccharide export outer membrane protein